MTDTLLVAAPLAAAGWSLFYVMLAGGLTGALLVLVAARMLGK